jgi:hypothetical protein
MASDFRGFTLKEFAKTVQGKPILHLAFLDLANLAHYEPPTADCHHSL